MSRKANCYDNAVMESFFGHLKEELFNRVRFLNTDALTAALHDYIHWYNTESSYQSVSKNTYTTASVIMLGEIVP